MIELPSNKVIITGVVTTVFVVTTIFISIKNKDAILNSDFFINKNPGNQTNSAIDLDGDGLLDWEEEMWETDMTNPDTDGDGTADGEEVRRGRNPLIVGPNDFVLANTPEYYLLEQKQVSDNFEEGTISDNLSKSLFSDFLTIEEDGSLGTLGNTEDLAKLVSGATEQVKFDDAYTISDIKTFDAKNTELLTNYATVVAQLEIDKLIKLSNMPKESTMIETLTIIEDHYRNLADVYTPDDLSEIHLSIVNDYAIFIQAITNLDNQSSDPVKAMVSVQEVEGIQIRQSTHFSKMASYFRERGIIFNDNEIGNLWNQY